LTNTASPLAKITNFFMALVLPFLAEISFWPLRHERVYTRPSSIASIAPRIFQRLGRSGPDVLSLERFVPSFNLVVRLRIVGRTSDVRHVRYPNELFEVLG